MNFHNMRPGTKPQLQIATYDSYPGKVRIEAKIDSSVLFEAIIDATKTDTKAKEMALLETVGEGVKKLMRANDKAHFLKGVAILTAQLN